MYVNLADKEGKTTLGLVDPTKDPDIIDNIKVSLIKKQIFSVIDNWLIHNNYGGNQTIKKTLYGLFQSYFFGDIKDLMAFEKEVLNSPFQVKFPSKGSLSDIYAPYIKYKFKTKFFDELINLTLGGGISTGKIEVFLALCSQIKNSVSKGDLQLNGKDVEVKGQQARFVGQNPARKDVTIAMKQLERILGNTKHFKKQDRKGLSGLKMAGIGKGYIKKFFELLNKQLLMNKKTIDDNLAKDIIVAFTNHVIKPADVKTDMIKLLKNFLKGSNSESLISWCLALHFYSYTKMEKIEFMFIGNIPRNKYTTTKVAGMNFTKSYKFISNFISMIGSWDKGKPAYKIDYV